MYKKLIVLTSLLLLLLSAGCQKQTANNIVTVNGEGITQVEYDRYYNLIKSNYEQQRGSALDETADKQLIDNIKNSIFEDLIMQKLIRQEASKQSVTVSKEEVEGVLNPFKQSKESEGAGGYQKFLDSMHTSEEDIRNQIEISILYDKLLDKVITDVAVTDEEARVYYNENEAMFKDPGGIQIYHILVGSEELARDIIARPKQGEDFAGLAAKYSTDPGSKDSGGDVGLVNESTSFVPEFKQAALALKPGQLNPVPVKSEYGYHIIKAGDRVAASQLSFADVKEDLKKQMELDQKHQAFEEYMQNLKNTADIKDLRQK
ncbi:MAG: peptidylprolyl isomerase [Syntrophomonadaceae bacterium]